MTFARSTPQAQLEDLVGYAHTPHQLQFRFEAPPTEYQEILTNSNSNSDLQIVIGSELVGVGVVYGALRCSDLTLFGYDVVGFDVVRI